MSTNYLANNAHWNVINYSSVFSAPIGTKLSLYIDESDNPNYPDRTNTKIGRKLVLKRVVEGEDYKIAHFERYATEYLVEFLQFDDGVGCLVEIDKYGYVVNDYIYNSGALLDVMCDADVRRRVTYLISGEIENDPPVCAFADLHKIKWSKK